MWGQAQEQEAGRPSLRMSVCGMEEWSPSKDVWPLGRDSDEYPGHTDS